MPPGGEGINRPVAGATGLGVMDGSPNMTHFQAQDCVDVWGEDAKIEGLVHRVSLSLVAILLLVSGGVSLSAESPESPAPDTSPQLKRLDLQGPPQQVFQELGRRYGVRMQVDSDLRGAPMRVRLGAADFRTALRIVANLAGAFWVSQPDGSVLVLEDTREKRQLYEPLEMRTFALPGRSAEELTEMLRLLREMVEPRSIAQDLRSNTITIRDTPRRLNAAAALLEHLAAGEDQAQVVVDALLFEVDSLKARSLGVLPPDLAVLVHVGAGILPTDNALEFLQAIEELVNQGVLPRVLLSDRFDLASGVGVVGLGKGRGQYFASLTGATLTFSDIMRVTRSLRQLHLRATTGHEASFFAGEQFPVTFTTFSSIFIPEVVQDLIDQGLFVPPVPAIQYEELGVKLAVTPRVHDNREVSLKVKIDTTQLVGENLNGIPILGNRTIEQQVRLREGESLLLAGMRNREETPTRVGWPVLGSIPLLGRLFSRVETRTRETEFMILLTPRIVRRGGANRKANWALYLGTEKEFSPAGRTSTGRRSVPSRSPRPAPNLQQRQPPPQQQQQQRPPQQPPPPQ